MLARRASDQNSCNQHNQYDAEWLEPSFLAKTRRAFIAILAAGPYVPAQPDDL